MFDKERKKERAIIQYIHQQRKNGWRDGDIRTHMVRWGHSTELLNNYFQRADQELVKRQALMVIVPLLVLFFVGFAFAKSNLTGAITWPWTTYDCGDDYPARAKYVKDLSDCVPDTEETKQNVFCYVNATVSTDTLSPNDANDDWYLNKFGIDLSLFSNTTDTVAVLGKAVVLPYNATTYDDVDCFRWTHGTTRSSNWHQCNATESVDIEPPNLVFYFTDVLEEENVGLGGLGTEFYYNSSYALCYDELNCTTSTTACDEDSGYYCVGRLDSTSGSAWYPCDTAQSASYYRCCKGGCEGIEMECGELIELPDGSVTDFSECSSDGTSGCCSAMTDCVYDSECYSEKETIQYVSQTLGLGGTSIEATMTEYTFVCSDSHWCPEEFEYDARTGMCEALQAACYSATNSDNCNYAFGTDDIDAWEADTSGALPCIRPDPDAVVYNESCIYSGTYGGVGFYFYEDITWY